MKNYTTRFLKLASLAYMAYPALYLLYAAVVFDVPAHQLVSIALSPGFWIVGFLSATAGYGLWEMRRWAWYVFVASNLLSIYLNALMLSEYGETSHKLIAFGVSLLIIAGMLYRVGREVRVPYFHPKIRWWESNPRYRLSVPVTITRAGGQALEGEILDISGAGCFVKLRADLSQDEPLDLSFTIFGEPIACRGMVVWRTGSGVTHPKGVGLKFSFQSRFQRRMLRAVQQRMRRIAHYYRSSRYLVSQEEFSQRFQELHAEKLHLPKLVRAPSGAAALEPGQEQEKSS